MSAFCTEFFGNPEQQDLQRRADLLWAVLEDNVGFCCHGRAVALADATGENVVTQVALAQLQGVCAVDGVPGGAVDARREALEAFGLKTDQFVKWQGGAEALVAAAEIVASRELAGDIEIVSVDRHTPAAELAKLDRLTQSCGVLLPMGAFLRGVRRPGVCLFARDGGGRVVGSAAAVAQYHPEHPNGRLVWWGMLATDDARRGEGIALILGAHAMLAMRDRHGFEDFMTGIREGNVASQRLCGKLGLAPTGNVDLIAVDPGALAGGRLTK